jgi:hypothetical protein
MGFSFSNGSVEVLGYLEVQMSFTRVTRLLIVVDRTFTYSVIIERPIPNAVGVHTPYHAGSASNCDSDYMKPKASVWVAMTMAKSGRTMSGSQHD